MQQSAAAQPQGRLIKKLKPKKAIDIRLEDQSFFAGNPAYHPELGMPRDGVLGDPVPYSVGNDNTITAILLACFVLAMVALSKSFGFIIRQGQNFFHTTKRAFDMTETDYERRFQSFLMLQTSILLGITYYQVENEMGVAELEESQLAAIGIFAALAACYFVLKRLLYAIVNWTFFDYKKNGQWIKAWLFLTSIEGVALFPIVLLRIYFNMPLHNMLVAVAAVIILVKILTFYKCYVIFFKGMGGFLQIFLYFCAVEIVPVMVLWGALNFIGNYLAVIL